MVDFKYILMILILPEAIRVLLAMILCLIKSLKRNNIVSAGNKMKKNKKMKNENNNKRAENLNIKNDISKEPEGEALKKSKNQDAVVVEKTPLNTHVTDSNYIDYSENNVDVKKNDKSKKRKSVREWILEIAEVFGISIDKKDKKISILEKILQTSKEQKKKILELYKEKKELKAECETYKANLETSNYDRVKENKDHQKEIASVKQDLDEERKKLTEISEKEKQYKLELDNLKYDLVKARENIELEKNISNERLSEINKLKAEYERKFAEKTREIEEQRANYKKKCEELMAEAFQCQDNPQARRLLAEKIDNIERNIEALSKIENVCLYIDQYSNYEELKKQVNRIKSILTDFHANER